MYRQAGKETDLGRTDVQTGGQTVLTTMIQFRCIVNIMAADSWLSRRQATNNHGIDNVPETCPRLPLKDFQHLCHLNIENGKKIELYFLRCIQRHKGLKVLGRF